jgi:hypothetical protein
MPQRQPFTALCQTLARLPRTARVDLHIHTTCSDGTYTPAQVVELARRSGMPALAITDHDTVDAIAPARAAAADKLEVVTGVELTATYRGRILHVLGYFFRPDDAALGEAMAGLRLQRQARFQEMVERLRRRGVSVEDEDTPSEPGSGTLGRRRLAHLLVKAGAVASVREAFARYLGDACDFTVPAPALEVAEAIALLRGAGGVAAWAHPSYDCTREGLLELRSLGLQVVEVDFPNVKGARQRELRALAAELGLAVSGGSDCHGPGAVAVGACGATVQELERLRELAR